MRSISCTPISISQQIDDTWPPKTLDNHYSDSARTVVDVRIMQGDDNAGESGGDGE